MTKKPEELAREYATKFYNEKGPYHISKHSFIAGHASRDAEVAALKAEIEELKAELALERKC